MNLETQEDSQAKEELLRAYEELYCMLSLVKHSTFSLVETSNVVSLVRSFSKGLTYMPGRVRHSVWLKEKGEFVEYTSSEDLPCSGGKTIRGELFTILEAAIKGRVVVFPDHPIWRELRPVLPDLKRPVMYPIKAPREVLGMILVDEVSSHEREFFQFLSQFLGNMIAFLRVHQELERAKKEVQDLSDLVLRDNIRQSTLHNIYWEMARARDKSQVCEILVRNAVREMGVRYAGLFVLEGQESLKGVCGTFLGTDITGVLLDKEDIGQFSRCVETGRVITWVGSDASLKLGDTTLKEWGIFPIKIKGRPFGLLVVDGLCLEVSDLLTILANHAAMQIQYLDAMDENERLKLELAKLGKEFKDTQPR